MIQLCFRLDDPSAISNHELEQGIIGSFSRHEIPLTVAVIPGARRGSETVPLRAQHVPHLIDAHDRGAIEIAQHGFLHAERSTTAAGVPSEFYGLPAQEQRSFIEQGARDLATVFQRRPIGFVPPWNTYDSATAGVLKQMQYRYVSASWDLPSPRLLPTVPLTCWLHKLRAAISEAKRFSILAPLIVTVIHAYDFKESGEPEAYISLQELDDILHWTRAQGEHRFLSLASAVEQHHSFDFGIALRELRSRLPWRFRSVLPEHCLLTNPLRRTPASHAGTTSYRHAPV